MQVIFNKRDVVCIGLKSRLTEWFMRTFFCIFILIGNMIIFIRTLLFVCFPPRNKDFISPQSTGIIL